MGHIGPEVHHSHFIKILSHIIKPWEAEAGGFLWVPGQPGLKSEFQDSHGYTEKPCLQKTKQNKTKQNKTRNKQQKENKKIANLLFSVIYLFDLLYIHKWARDKSCVNMEDCV